MPPELSAKLEEFSAMLVGLEEQLLSATGQHEHVAELRKSKQSEAHKYREALREERQEHDKTINITHELQLKIQELEQKLRQIEDRARENLRIKPSGRKNIQRTMRWLRRCAGNGLN